MTVRELCIALGNLIEDRIINYDTEIMIDNSVILDTIQCGRVVNIEPNNNLNTLFIKQGV